MEGEAKKIHGQNNHFHMVYCTTSHPLNQEQIIFMKKFPYSPGCNDLTRH